ncbi:MAG TPA: MurR/RpiR family transcriptional regulator [Companilactobacillus farciminis]|uniref:MurR/RpiR family transcriptional regulator n=1 Tax=Companilactobacillus farciminis TaxID=1612 RepID=A0A921HUE3_9LACO|nr:MurR/RpiR family transcriptional regulator [Companilactobacillus farciminis]
MLIRDRLNNFQKGTDAELLIRDFFLKRKNDLVKISTHTIAKELYISASTITRFCQKLGFLGYPDFVKQYQEENEYLDSHFNNIDPNIPFLSEDTTAIVNNKIGTLYKEIINDSLALLKKSSLNTIEYLIRDCDHIYIYAAGDLILAAENFENKMIKVGKTVSVERRGDNAFFKANYSDANSLFILLSYSGETDNLLKIAHRLNDKQLPFVAVTTMGGNSLTELTNNVIYISTREKLINNLGNFSSVLSAMFVLDILYADFVNENQEQALNNKKQVSKLFENRRSSRNPLLEDN